MDSISEQLRPYRHQLWLTALVFSCVKLLRGVGLLLRQRNGSQNGEVSFRPLLGAVFMAILGMRIAQMNEDNTMMALHTTSLVVNLTYLCLFYNCASNNCKRCILERTLIVTILTGVCLSYSAMGESPQVQRDLSVVMTATTSLLIVMGMFQKTGYIGCMISIVVVSSKVLYALSTQQQFLLYQTLWVLALDILRISVILYRTFQSSEEEQCDCIYCRRGRCING